MNELGALISSAIQSMMTGSSSVLAVLCLLIYGRSAFRQKAQKASIARYQQEMAGLESEIQVLLRDRSLTRLEIQILREILTQNDFSKALTALLRRLVPNPDMGMAAILPVDGQWLPQSRGMSNVNARKLKLSPAMLEEVRQNGSLIIEGTRLLECPLYASLDLVDRAKVQSLYVVGLGDKETMFAVLVCNALIPFGAPRAEQIEMTSRLVASLASTLKQTLELEQQTIQLRTTRDMLELRSIVDGKYDQPIKAIERFLVRLAQMVEFDRVAIYLTSKDNLDNPRALLRSGMSLTPALVDRWQGHEDQLANNAIVHDHFVSYEHERLRRYGVDSLIGRAVSCPLVYQDLPIGLICLTRRVGNDTNSAQQHLIEWAGQTLAQVIQRLSSFLEVERQAKQDGLTGLANRRSLDRQLEIELRKVEEGSTTECSFLLLDIDRFKSVNDIYGHQIGDEVLRQTARVLREQMLCLRSGDTAFLARYGGEEMAVLLPGVGASGATRIAELIRIAIECNSIHTEEVTLSVTASIGVSTAPWHSDQAGELIAIADQALYTAKNQGRNRVVMATGLPIGK